MILISMPTFSAIIFFFFIEAIFADNYELPEKSNSTSVLPYLCKRIPNLSVCKQSMGQPKLRMDSNFRNNIPQDQLSQIGTRTVPSRFNGQTETLLAEKCQELLPVARRRCISPRHPKIQQFCSGFFLACFSDPLSVNDLIETSVDEPDELEKVASLYSNDVGVVSGAWGVNGIPYYPFNPEGSLSGGNRKQAKFGTWGVGLSDETGVRNFWRGGKRAGGNWYTGNYGAGRHWQMPFLPGIEGGSGTNVRVPVNSRNFGEPIEMSRRSHVGQYWDGGNEAEVDWLDGAVGNGNGWSIPAVGISGGIGDRVTFPSLGDILPYLENNGLRTRRGSSRRSLRRL